MNKLKFILDCKSMNKSIKTILLYLKKEGSLDAQLAIMETRNYMLNAIRIIRILKNYGVKINIRLFNTIILIYTFEKMILPKDNSGSEMKEKYRLKIINSVYNIIDKFINYDPKDKLCMLSLTNKFKQYVINFDLWKEIDKVSIVKTFASIYHKYNDIIKFIRKNKTDDELYMDELEHIEHLTKSKENIMKKIKNINGYDIFKTITPKKIEITDSDIGDVAFQIEETSLDLLNEDYLQTPIDMTHTIIFLSEIKKIIRTLFVSDKLITEDLAINTEFLAKKFTKPDVHQVITCICYYFEFFSNITEENEEHKKIYKKFKRNLIEGNELFQFIPTTIKYLVKQYYGLIRVKTDKKSIVEKK